jgi:hypothetical protein
MLAVYGVMALTDIQPGEAYQAVDPPPLNSGLAHCCKTKSRAARQRSAAKLWSPEQRLLHPPFSDLPPTPSRRLPRLHPNARARAAAAGGHERPRSSPPEQPLLLSLSPSSMVATKPPPSALIDPIERVRREHNTTIASSEEEDQE